MVQALGVGWCLRGERPEVGLLVGALLYALGSIIGIGSLERYLESIARPGRWALTALFGPVGPLVVLRLAPGAAAAAPVGSPPRNLLDRIVAVAVTIAAGGGLVWAAAQWAAGPQWPTRATPPDLRHNELLAYRRLGEITVAQRRYAEKDWDGDGKQGPAEFYAHLWQSVDGAGNPVPVGLISRELAFAMVEKYALDGYVFRSLHHRDPGSPGPPAEDFPSFQYLDPNLAWAVAATPLSERKTGMLGFVADSTGTVWTYQYRPMMPAVTDPGDPTARGWIKISSAAHLAEIQRNVDYPEAAASAGR
jgi:hypothetical protein